MHAGSYYRTAYTKTWLSFVYVLSREDYFKVHARIVGLRSPVEDNKNENYKLKYMLQTISKYVISTICT